MKIGRTSLKALSKKLKECCGELEPSEEEFDIFRGGQGFRRRIRKIQKE